LHGSGDGGADNLSQLVHVDTTIYPGGQLANCPFFVCVPQCLHDGWLTKLSESQAKAHHVEDDADMLDAAVKIIEQLQKDYPIDERRMTVLGISSGGTACWELLRRYPHRFAAAVPLGDGGSEIAVGGTVDTPIWAFHAAHDPSVSPDGAAKTITSIKAAGGKAYLTLTEDETHNCWTTAFAEHDLLHWLLNQRLDDPSVPQPGSHRLAVSLRLWWHESWPGVVLFFAVALLLVASYRHVRRISSSRCSEPSQDNQANGVLLSHSWSDHAHFGVALTESIPLDGDFKIPDFSRKGNEP
jgi:dienelactone hydrolase